MRAKVTAVACLMVLNLCVAAMAADIDMSVKVSPAVLVLSAPTQWITIHTDMPLSRVDRSSLNVAVNGCAVPIAVVMADSRGQMVLKLTQADVDLYVAPPSATFVVTGCTKDPSTFEGTDTIRVKN